MADTPGLVQRLTILTSTTACAWIGPNATNTELLVVTNDGTATDAAFSAELVQVLSAAATNYRPVTATHDDGNAKITSIRVEPV